jgi:hypothetical protein
MQSTSLSKFVFFSLSSVVSISTIIKSTSSGILNCIFNSSIQFPKSNPDIPVLISSIGSKSLEEITWALKFEPLITVLGSTKFVILLKIIS